MTDTERKDFREAVELLGVMFDGYEEGTPCYEMEGGEQGPYLGPAFRLSDEHFHRIADLLNRLAPRTPPAAEHGQG